MRTVRFLAFICLISSALEAQTNSVRGFIRNAAGQPVAGAVVRISSDKPGLGFIVVSRERGAYQTPELPAGKYNVQSFGGNFQSGPLSVEVANKRAATADLTLNASLKIPAPSRRLNDADYEKLMPEGGVGKQYISGKCADCHSLGWIITARKSHEAWLQTVERMYDDVLGHRYPLFLAVMEAEPVQAAAGTPDRSKALGSVERQMVDYLAKYYGPETPADPRALTDQPISRGGPTHPNRNLPSQLLKGEAAAFTAMEFSLPSGSLPRDLAMDSHGTVWVSESSGGMLGRFEPASLAYSRITLPPAKAQSELSAIATDGEGNVWVADDGPNARILRYHPQSQQFDSYAIPDYPFPVPTDGPFRIGALQFSNGNLWATRTTAHRILKLDPVSKKVQEFSAPKGSAPFGIAAGSNNQVWFSAEVGNEIVKLDPVTGQLGRYSAPALRSDLRGIAADATGNLWAAGQESSSLIRLDPAGKATEFNTPSQESGPFAIDVDPKRNVIWMSEMFTDRIARFDPAANQFTEFPTTSADADIRRVVVDRSRPNRVWWAGGGTDKIGYLEVSQ